MLTKVREVPEPVTSGPPESPPQTLMPPALAVHSTPLFTSAAAHTLRHDRFEITCSITCLLSISCSTDGSERATTIYQVWFLL